MSFDPKCYELAEHFLLDGTDNELKNELAQYIQEKIEFWFSAVGAGITIDSLKEEKRRRNQ